MTDILCDPHPLHGTCKCTCTSRDCESYMASTVSTNVFVQDRNSFLTQLINYDSCVNVTGS
jgi:hypothetical protein